MRYEIGDRVWYFVAREHDRTNETCLPMLRSSEVEGYRVEIDDWGDRCEYYTLSGEGEVDGRFLFESSTEAADYPELHCVER